jgi:hypothetical protein
MEEKRQDHHIDVICGCVVMGTESEIGTGGVLIIGHIG